MGVKRRAWKWCAFGLLTLLLYLVESALLPPVFGVSICCLAPFTVLIGMHCGPYAGAAFGAVAGFLMDVGMTSALGFSGMLLLVLGGAAGLAVLPLRVNFWLSLLFCAAGMFLFSTVRWFFLYGLWHAGEELLYLRVVPLQVLYATIAAAPLYFLVRWIDRRLEPAA